jgi:hypothetical protein
MGCSGGLEIEGGTEGEGSWGDPRTTFFSEPLWETFPFLEMWKSPGKCFMSTRRDIKKQKTKKSLGGGGTEKEKQ